MVKATCIIENYLFFYTLKKKLIQGNNIISAAVIPASAATGLYFYPIIASLIY